MITGFNITPQLGLFNHIDGRTIFYTARRVVALELGKNGIGGFSGDTLQLNQAAIAYSLINCRVLHGLASKAV